MEMTYSKYYEKEGLQSDGMKYLDRRTYPSKMIFFLPDKEVRTFIRKSIESVIEGKYWME